MGPLSPIISALDLRNAQVAPDDALRIVDVRWVLGQLAEGRRAWLASRIPGAVFLDVDTDLAQIVTPRHGRHPLPSPQHLVDRLAAVGIGEGARVVAYDDAGGATAARLWWLLGWIGFDDVRVLDGGLRAWLAASLPVEGGAAPTPQRAKRAIVPVTRNEWVVTRAEVEALVAEDGRGQAILLDARAPERYRGEVEPVDPRPGHIPGALNAPFTANLRPDGTFLPPEELHRRYGALGAHAEVDVVSYCGSGVTACHDLLALALAGHPRERAHLYAGSYSEWSNDPELPVLTGDKPHPEALVNRERS